MNGYSAGGNITLHVIGPAGPLVMDQITAFSSNPVTEDFTAHCMDGVTRHATFQRGWRGQFTLERRNAIVDKFFANLENNYYAGKPLLVGIIQTIAESDGSISQFHYIGAVLKLDSAGEWRGDATTKQIVSFLSAERVQLA